MKLERNSQHKKVHAAIDATDKAVGKPLPTMNDVEGFVIRIRNRATLERRYGKALHDFEIKDGRGYGWAVGYEKFITVPTAQRSTIYVLRAIAYTIMARYRTQWYRDGNRYSELHNRAAAWTGWQYCAILMDLVRYGLGEDEADVLRTNYEKNKVRWSKPVKRTLTDQQKADLKLRGEALAYRNWDRKRRQEYSKKYPEAKLLNEDEFEEDWETLYRVWR